MSIVFGFSGRIGAGKDTIALCLEEYAQMLWPKKMFVQCAFAEALKDLCIQAFGIPTADIYGDRVAKLKALPRNPNYTIRDALKIIGKAYMDLDPEYWINKAHHNAAAFLTQHGYLGHGVICFTDVRYPNEMDSIRVRGGKVIRFLRKGHLTPEEEALPSEHALDDATFDAVIDNREQTPKATLAAVIKELGKWKMLDNPL